MKPSVRIGILALVVIAVGAIVAVKFRDEKQASVQSSQRTRPLAASPVSTQARASVLLFANLSEANETEDACGMIIRAVRSAREHGMTVTEYDSGAAPDVRKQYRVIVDPTVIMLDSTGREIARHEGEDANTVTAIRADLKRIRGGRA